MTYMHEYAVMKPINLFVNLKTFSLEDMAPLCHPVLETVMQSREIELSLTLEYWDSGMGHLTRPENSILKMHRTSAVTQFSIKEPIKSFSLISDFRSRDMPNILKILLFLTSKLQQISTPNWPLLRNMLPQIQCILILS